MLYNRIKHVLPGFCFEGVFEDIYEMQSGNINSTYCLIFRKGNERLYYTLQNINSYVFKDPAAVMHNMSLVCEHLRDGYKLEGVSPSRRVIELIETRDGGVLHIDAESMYWRAYRFINDATAHNTAEKPEFFYEAGRGFGEFQRRLHDCPAERLIETIPNFHNTKKRFYSFAASIDRDSAGRVKEVEDVIDFLFDRWRLAGQIVDRITDGTLPLRVTHNDTKINNVMIDDSTGCAICVIDLDTVMPGSALYDFGDAIRFGASTAAEDEEDLSKVSLDMDLFRLFTKGYLSEMNGILTAAEKSLLPLGVRVITYEQVLRFLTDYIDGDLYFKVKHPRHNIVRARAQMRLLEDIEKKYDEMHAAVEALS